MSQSIQATRILPQAHPDHLRALVSLFGFAAAPVETARILDLGCGDGSHLLALATYLPDARLVGIDKDAIAIECAQQIAKAAGFTNLRFMCGDIEALSLKAGVFDYVICHDVFSHVNQNIRHIILKQIAHVLTPTGVALVSYDAYPGWKKIEWWRDCILAYLAKAESATINEIAEYIAFTLMNLPEHLAWSAALREVGEEILSCDPAQSIIKMMNNDHSAFTLPDFIQLAEQHHLVYAGDVRYQDILNPPLQEYDRIKMLNHFSGNPISRQYYFDYLYDQSQHQTLLIKRQQTALIDPGYGITLDTLLKLYIQGNFQPPVYGGKNWRSHTNKSVEIADTPYIRPIFERLNQVGNGTVQVLELLQLLPQEQHESAVRIIVDLISTRAVNIRASQLCISSQSREMPKLRPRLRRLIKATMQNEHVNALASPWLRPLELDDAMAWLTTKMTGQYSIDVLAKSLAKACSMGKFSDATLAAIAGESSSAPDWQAIAQVKTEKLVNWLASQGLLEPESSV
ncbi:class I SAM-dependent methyltransferase [Cardiobacteriaceae bacterium TAE3-ERU3]|nr:class I SAM-dependent methyltransferase [Cardiobacteriaceae bacterium TAE3-ERU3]